MKHVSKLQMQRCGWVALVLGIICLDQGSKWMALHHLQVGGSLPVMPFLSFSLAYNHGVAFGGLAGLHGWQSGLLIGVVVGVIFYLMCWLTKIQSGECLLGMVLSLILSGAVGNLIDRFMHGYVVDFIDFHWLEWHWYVFNIADVAITVGVVLLLIQMGLEDSAGET